MNSSTTGWDDRVKRVVEANDLSELQQGYDAWADQYDADHANFGQLLLVHFVGMFCRHVPQGTGPILDAGAGTGRMGETLYLHGYENFFAIDLSSNMLEVAGKKPGYQNTKVMRLGDPLDFASDSFPVVASIAAFSPNHAQADAFDELIRITEPGGKLILSLRGGHEAETGYNQRRQELEEQGRWRLLDETGEFVSHPELDPPMKYGVYVYEKL